MIIKLSQEYEIKNYKIDKNFLNEKDKSIVERVSRDSFMQELNKIFQEYSNCLEAYKSGFINTTQKDKVQNELYEKSGYSDIYDFFYDYSRWKVGMPIYIKFALV